MVSLGRALNRKTRRCARRVNSAGVQIKEVRPDGVSGRMRCMLKREFKVKKKTCKERIAAAVRGFAKHLKERKEEHKALR